MKDLNDLMQAILEMDAAQRKASEEALAEQKQRMSDLTTQKTEIAKACAANAKAAAEQAAAARRQQNDAALAGLKRKEAEAIAALDAAMAQQRGGWTAELVRRALGETDSLAENHAETR